MKANLYIAIIGLDKTLYMNTVLMGGGNEMQAVAQRFKRDEIY